MSLQLENPTQSSTNPNYPASNALDGKLKFVLGCSMTKDEMHPWWRAELHSPHFITKINIVPRSDKRQYRYTNVSAHTSMDGTTWTLCEDLGYRLAMVEDGEQKWFGVECPVGTFGKYVRLIQYNEQRFTVCEVEVEGYQGMCI